MKLLTVVLSPIGLEKDVRDLTNDGCRLNGFLPLVRKEHPVYGHVRHRRRVAGA
jgi:hypothetical protein